MGSHARSHERKPLFLLSLAPPQGSGMHRLLLFVQLDVHDQGRGPFLLRLLRCRRIAPHCWNDQREKEASFFVLCWYGVSSKCMPEAADFGRQSPSKTFQRQSLHARRHVVWFE